MTQRKLEVLSIMWKSDKPMTAREIADARNGITQSTVNSVLKKLLDAELVEVVGTTHSGNAISRTYRPSEKAKQYIMSYIIGLYSMFKDVINPEEMYAAIKELQ